MLEHQQGSSKNDRFLLDYNADEIRIAGEFLSSWFPFPSGDFCNSCTHTLSRRIRSLQRDTFEPRVFRKQSLYLREIVVRSAYTGSSLDPTLWDSLEAVGDAERLKQQEYFTVLTPELPDSNGCNTNLDNCYNNSLGSWQACADLNGTADTNSLGSCKDGADVQEPFDEALAPTKKSDSYVGGTDPSLGSLKEYADLNDTADTNSLGSCKDSADVREPFDEALACSNKSDSYVGGTDRSLGSWKGYADLNDTTDTNSLGSWKDRGNGKEPFDESLVRRNNSDSYVGGADRSSKPVKEASRSKTFRSSKPAARWSMKMPWADMSQEDDLDADKISESNSRHSQLGNGNGVNKEEACIQETKPKMELSREHKERILFCNVKRKKDFICLERVNGKIVNILDGLELHTGVFSMAEQNRIVRFVEKLEEMGKSGQLKERTYTAPQKWMRGKGRVTIQFGGCYNYATDKKGNPPGILRSETVDQLPDLLKNMIRRLVRWHVLPPGCVPDSCVVNIYEEGDCIPPHIDSHDFLRPFCTVSFLSECNIVFGSNLKTIGLGDFVGGIAIPLPMGSVLVLNGNVADVAEHCVPAVPTKRISITFRRMDESRRPIGCTPEQDLRGLQPLSHEVDRYEKSNTSKPCHSTRKQLGRQEENKETVNRTIERSSKRHYMDRNRQGPANRGRVSVYIDN